jgi:hypothetical protein
MPLPGVPQTFAVENARDMTDKLYWEIEEYGKEPDIEKKLWRAFNCAVTACHVTDWLWREKAAKNPKLKLGKFQAEMESRCEALLACRYIANASKHGGVDRKQNSDIAVIVRAIGAEIGDDVEAIFKSKHWEIVIKTATDETDALTLFYTVQQYWDSLIESQPQKPSFK